MRFFRWMMVGWLGTVLGSSVSVGQTTPPRVVVAWASGLMEVRVAFDRAVDPEVAKQVVGQGIEFGEGEKPGVVGRVGGDRGTLRVAAARLEDDGRTLVLVTDPHPRDSTYRLTLPVLKAPVEYDLGGVEVTISEGSKKWTGWWPVIDPLEARKLTQGSAEHDQIWSRTSPISAFTLQTLVRSATGNASLTLDAPHPFELTFGGETEKSKASKLGDQSATVKAEGTGDPILLSLTLTDPKTIPDKIGASVSGVSLRRSSLVVPWAPPGPPVAAPSALPPQLLTGGDPVKGEAVFYGEQAKCANCHQVRGKGGLIGPDLTNLAGRDRAWVYQNIIEPSASIHPNYVSYTVSMKDGRIAMGVVHADGADAVKVSDIDAKETVIPRAEVEEIRPSSSSIMPVGLLGAIGDDSTRDLLAYLTGVKK